MEAFANYWGRKRNISSPKRESECEGVGVNINILVGNNQNID